MDAQSLYVHFLSVLKHSIKISYEALPDVRPSQPYTGMKSLDLKPSQ